MKLRTRHEERALVVSLGGRVDSGNARELEAKMEGMLDERGRGIILDCAELTYMSSAGLRVLLRITRRFDRQRVPFMVCSLSSTVTDVFRLSGFDRVIPVADSRADALATLPR